MADLEDIEALAVFAELFEAGGLTEDEFRMVKFRLLGSDHAPSIRSSDFPESHEVSPPVQHVLEPQETQFLVVLQLDADWESDREAIALLIAQTLDDSIEDVRQVLVDRNSVIVISPDRKEAEQAVIDLADRNISTYLKIVQPPL